MIQISFRALCVRLNAFVLKRVLEPLTASFDKNIILSLIFDEGGLMKIWSKEPAVPIIHRT